MTKRRCVLLALAYAIAVGAYFGFVLGLRLNPDFLDHHRGITYGGAILLFGVILHAQRSLTAASAWAAYLVCAVCFFAVASALGNEMTRLLAEWHVYLPALAAVVFLGGLVAHGAGLAIRKFLLPRPMTAQAVWTGLLPWLPLLVLVAMTAHTVQSDMESRAVSQQRWQYYQKIETIQGLAISLAAQGRTAELADGGVVIRIALPKTRYAADEQLQVLMVFCNQGDQEAIIPRPIELAQWLRMRDADGSEIPFNVPPEWAVADIAVAPIRLAPGDHTGSFVPLRPWFTLAAGTAYRMSLVWTGRESEALKFTIAE